MSLMWCAFNGEGLTKDQNNLTMVKINRVLDSWCGTRHIAGQRCKGSGVDCVQLVGAFLDEMSGVPRGTTEIPRLPQTIGSNDPTGIKGAPVLHAILKKNSAISLKPRIVQPGDILVCRLGSCGGAGHAMIVSGYDNKCVHACTSAGQVVKAGIGSVLRAMHVYRVDNRINWHRE